MKPVPEETNEKGTVSRKEINISCFSFSLLYFLCLHKLRQCAKHTHTMTPCPQPIFTDALTVRCSNQTHIHPHIHTPTIHRVVQPPLQKSSTDSVRCLPAHDILWSHWLVGTQHGLGWLTAMLQLPTPWTWARHLPQTTSKKAARERATETTWKVTQPTLSALRNSTPGQWHPSYNEILGMSRHEHSSKELTHKPKKKKRGMSQKINGCSLNAEGHKSRENAP